VALFTLIEAAGVFLAPLERLCLPHYGQTAPHRLLPRPLSVVGRSRAAPSSGLGVCALHAPILEHGHRRNTDCVWRVAVRNATQAGSGGFAAECHYDISKCYEHLRFGFLVRQSELSGFPLRLLRLSIRSYRWPRRIQVGGLVGPPLTPCIHAVVAGSSFATYELVLYFAPWFVGHMERCPAADLAAHVDDLVTATRAGTRAGVVQSLRDASSDLVALLINELALPIAWDKFSFVTSDAKLGRLVAAAFGRAGGEAPPAVRLLGVDHRGATEPLGASPNKAPAHCPPTRKAQICQGFVRGGSSPRFRAPG